MRFKILLAALSLLFVRPSTFAQVDIPQPFVGINAWMPDSVNTQKYWGKLHEHWTNVEAANTSVIRIGGIAADKRVFTNHQLLEIVDSIQAIGAEPLIQVSLWGGTYTASEAAAVVTYINVTKNRNVKYWSIGNEPNLVYSSTSYDPSFTTYTASDYADDVKAFSIAMKNVDADIQIIAGELAGFVYSWIDALLEPGGAADITGNNGTHDYVDLFSYHTYPFSGSQTKGDVFGSMATFEGKANYLKTKLTAANAYHNRNQDIGYAITELNVNYLNPTNNTPEGVGTNSFLAGQWWTDMIHTAVESGATFLQFWSIVEGGDGSSTDHGFISHTTGKLKPTYYHYQQTAQYLLGQQFPCTDNQDSVKVYATGDEDGYIVTILNYEDSQLPLKIQLDNSSISGTDALQINANIGLNKSYQDTVPALSTHWLFFTKNGHYQGKLAYTQTDATNNTTPSFESYNPQRSEKVMAHYLPWFDDGTGGYGRAGWCHEGDCTDLSNKSSVYTPLIGEYSQFNEEVIKYHIRTAIAARIDGFLINVNPDYNFQNEIFSKVCAAAKAVNAECGSNDFKIAMSWDNSSETTYNNIVQLFQKAEDSLYNHPQYSSLVWTDDATGKPILMVWSEADWGLYRTAIDSVFGKDSLIALGRNSIRQSQYDANFEWIGYLWSQGSALDTTTNWGEQYFNDFDWGMERQVEYGNVSDYRFISNTKMGGVYPGFSDKNVPAFWNGGNWRYIKRDVTAGNTMELTWDKQLAYTPRRYFGDIEVYNPWIQLITWNDFPEGTSIEPSILSQYGFEALETNRSKIASFKSVSTTDADTLGIYVPYEIYKAIDEGRTADANSALTYLCAKDYANAYDAAKGIVLPVEWLDFWAEQRDKGHQLYWTIASMHNHAYFNIEYSRDGKHFSTIGTDYREQLQYDFLHNTQAQGLHYYRIQQVDKDGTVDYSKVIVLSSTAANIHYSINGDELQFQQAFEQIEVYNALGQLIHTVFDTESVQLIGNGLFMVVLRNGEEVKVLRVRK